MASIPLIYHHKQKVIDGLHIAHSFEYADSSARNSVTSSDVTGDDVNKLALQLDNRSLWILTNNNPVTWQLVSYVDKSKVDTIQPGAQVNQNTFSNITVGGTTINATAQTDNVTLIAGNKIILTPNVVNKTINIAVDPAGVTPIPHHDMHLPDFPGANDIIPIATTTKAGLMPKTAVVKLNQLHPLINGENITLTPEGDNIRISSTGGSANVTVTSRSGGLDSQEITLPPNGNNLIFRSIRGGAGGITVTSDANSVIINGPDVSPSASDLHFIPEDGITIERDADDITIGDSFLRKTLEAGDGIRIEPVGDTIVITNTVAGGGREAQNHPDGDGEGVVAAVNVSFPTLQPFKTINGIDGIDVTATASTVSISGASIVGNIPHKTLDGDNGITVTPDGDTIVVSNTFKNKNLVEGTGIRIVQDDDNITISSTGGGGSGIARNIPGDDEGVYFAPDIGDGALLFKRLKGTGGTSVTTDENNVIVIHSSIGGGIGGDDTSFSEMDVIGAGGIVVTPDPVAGTVTIDGSGVYTVDNNETSGEAIIGYKIHGATDADGSTLKLKSLRATPGSGISITSDTNSIIFTGSGGGGSGGSTTASNIGGGANSAGLFSAKVADDLRFRSIQGLGGIAVSQTGNNVTIDGTGLGGGGSIDISQLVHVTQFRTVNVRDTFTRGMLVNLPATLTERGLPETPESLAIPGVDIQNAGLSTVLRMRGNSNAPEYPCVEILSDGASTGLHVRGNPNIPSSPTSPSQVLLCENTSSNVNSHVARFSGTNTNGLHVDCLDPARTALDIRHGISKVNGAVCVSGGINVHYPVQFENVGGPLPFDDVTFPLVNYSAQTNPNQDAMKIVNGGASGKCASFITTGLVTLGGGSSYNDNLTTCVEIDHQAGGTALSLKNSTRAQSPLLTCESVSTLVNNWTASFNSNLHHGVAISTQGISKFALIVSGGTSEFNGPVRCTSSFLAEFSEPNSNTGVAIRRTNGTGGSAMSVSRQGGNGDAVIVENWGVGAGISVTSNNSIGLSVASFASTSDPNPWCAKFSNGSSGNGVMISSQAGTTALMVNGNSQTNGNSTITGTKSAVVQTESHGTRVLYSEESTEIWFSDYGFVTLVNGSANVSIDAAFAETIDFDCAYHIELTAYGECNSLSVRDRSRQSFTIKENSQGHSNIEVGYKIIAKRKGFADKRLETFNH